MIALVYCCLYLTMMMALGFLLFSVIHGAGRLTPVQLLGLVPALGAGTLGLLLFWLSLLGFVPSRPRLCLIGIATLAGLLLLKKFHRLARFKISGSGEKIDRWCILLWLVIVAAVVTIAAGNLSTPLTEWDAFAIWGFKAKVLAHEALRPTPAYFHDLTLSYSHLDYPLLVPFLTAGAYAAMGTVDDQTGKLVSIFLDVLIVPLIYLGLRSKLARLPAACLCLMTALLPVFLRFAGSGCADLPLAMFYAGSIFYVARWTERQRAEDLILAILFSAFAAFTKNEGLVLALINGLMILAQAMRLRQIRIWIWAAIFFAGLLAVEAAWLFWSRSLPRTHEDYGSKLLSAQLLAGLPKLKGIFLDMALQMTSAHFWGWLWGLTGLLAVLGWRAFFRADVLVLWFSLGLQLLAYALAYSVTPWDLAQLLPTTLDRLLWHTIPVVMLLAGWHWAEIAAPRAISRSNSDAAQEPAL